MKSIPEPVKITDIVTDPNAFFKPGHVWPFYRLSDQTELCYQGRIIARSLITVIVPHTHYGVPTKRKPMTIKPGDRVMIVHNHPGSLLMSKVSSGQYRYLGMKESVQEGIDFELIAGHAIIDWNG